MNRIVEEYIKKQNEIANKEKNEKRAEFLEELGLFEKIYSENTKYTDEYPSKETDEESEHYGKYYKAVPLEISDEEYAEIEKAYELNNDPKTDEDGVSVALKCIAIFIFVVGGVLSLFAFTADIFTGVAAMFSVFVSGMTFLGFSRIIKLLYDIKNK